MAATASFSTVDCIQPPKRCSFIFFYNFSYFFNLAALSSIQIKVRCSPLSACTVLLCTCMCVCATVLATHPSWSVRSHITLGVGISGEPSYKTTEAPTAKADTSQFHIIQPVYGWTHTHTHTGHFICHKQPFVTNKYKWKAKWKNSGSYASACEVFLFLIFNNSNQTVH